MHKNLWKITTALAGILSAVAALPAPASAAAPVAPNLTRLVAYVRDGNIYLSKGAAETRLTTDGGYARPRWSPDGTALAYLKNDRLWTMKADGTARRQLSTRTASGASWSPDGASIAFASLSCTGGPGVYRISTRSPEQGPQVLFPAECRQEPIPADAPVVTAVPRGAGAITEKLRADTTVAWSPDGARVAFRGGDCESIYDSCLSVGTVVDGAEITVAAFGGGSRQTSGFAAVPSFSPDGGRLAYTRYQRGETVADNEPVHVVEYDLHTRVSRTLGVPQDRELAYLSTDQVAVTGQYRNSSWVLILSGGAKLRQPFHPGSQPSVQPGR